MNLIGSKSDASLQSELYTPILNTSLEGIRHSSVSVSAPATENNSDSDPEEMKVRGVPPSELIIHGQMIREAPRQVSLPQHKEGSESPEVTDSDLEAFQEEINERRLAEEFGLYDHGQDDYDEEEAFKGLDAQMDELWTREGQASDDSDDFDECIPIQTIVARIKQLREQGLLDPRVLEIVEEEFPRIESHFGIATSIDKALLGCKKRNGYWRPAYDFPVDGQEIIVEGRKVIAVNCGLFSFDFIDAKVVTGQIPSSAHKPVFCRRYAVDQKALNEEIDCYAEEDGETAYQKWLANCDRSPPRPKYAMGLASHSIEEVEAFAVGLSKYDGSHVVKTETFPELCANGCDNPIDGDTTIYIMTHREGGEQITICYTCRWNFPWKDWVDGDEECEDCDNEQCPTKVEGV